MRTFIRIGVACATLVSACGGDSTGLGTGSQLFRVVNAFTSPVDVLVDGRVAMAAVPAGAISTTTLVSGGHSIGLRRSDSTAVIVSPVTTSGQTLGTVAAVLTSSGSLSTATLDDTGSVVPAGATKVRVLHLAPKAGEIVVYRTQPDYQTPVSWQFPFTYQANPTSLSAPFFQSTVGTWEIRAWRKADSLVWSSARVKTSFSLGSGQKRTVVVLDDGAGGIRLDSF